MEDLTIFDLKIGFLVKFYLYIQILRSIGLRLGQNIKKFVYKTVFLKSVHEVLQGPPKRAYRTRLNERLQLSEVFLDFSLWMKDLALLDFKHRFYVEVPSQGWSPNAWNRRSRSKHQDVDSFFVA